MYYTNAYAFIGLRMRNLHDAFAKEWMGELLADFGKVEVEKPIAGEVRTIDIVFSPHASAQPDRLALGLLGHMIAQPCLLEPFRNAVPEEEIINCRQKLFELIIELNRRAKQKKQPRPKPDLPILWMLSPTVSAARQKRFRMIEKRRWGQGIYFLPDADRSAVVALHHLPRTLDTLWLRLLGRGQVQSDAVNELLALPIDHPYRQETIHHLARWQINLKARQNKTKDLKEVMMSLSPAYEQWRQVTLAEGRQEGRQEGYQEKEIEIALRMLKSDMSLSVIAQFTNLSIAQLQQLQANHPSELE
jgi:hypothetical protein